MELGTYVLLLTPPDCFIIDQMKLQGSAPCYTYKSLDQAKAAKAQLEKEFVYTVRILQIIG